MEPRSGGRTEVASRSGDGTERKACVAASDGPVLAADPTQAGCRRFRSSFVTLVAVSCVLVLVAAGCFRLVDNRSHGVGAEYVSSPFGGYTRLNVVVYRKATRWVYDEKAVKESYRAARNIFIAVSPDKFKLSTSEKAVACLFLGPLGCTLGLDQVGRIVLSGWKADLRNRGDFNESLRDAARGNRCFAWTFVPERNFTTKPNGNSGCRFGALS